MSKEEELLQKFIENAERQTKELQTMSDEIRGQDSIDIAMRQKLQEAQEGLLETIMLQLEKETYRTIQITVVTRFSIARANTILKSPNSSISDTEKQLAPIIQSVKTNRQRLEAAPPRTQALAITNKLDKKLSTIQQDLDKYEKTWRRGFIGFVRELFMSKEKFAAEGVKLKNSQQRIADALGISKKAQKVEAKARNKEDATAALTLATDTVSKLNKEAEQIEANLKRGFKLTKEAVREIEATPIRPNPLRRRP